VFKKILAYSSLFLTSFVVFLVVLTPAAFLWEHGVKNRVDLRGLGVRVDTVTGTLWHGQALLNYQGVGGLLQWNIDAAGLLGLSVPLALELKTHGGQAEIDVNAGVSQTEIVLRKLDFAADSLNTLLKRRRVTLDGEVFAKDFRLLLEDNKLVDASGRLSWSGGNIAYPVQRDIHERLVPSFSGEIVRREDGMIYLGLKDPESRFDPIELSLLPDGLGMIQVRRRLLDLVDEPWSKNSDERDVVFKVKKPIY